MSSLKAHSVREAQEETPLLKSEGAPSSCPVHHTHAPAPKLPTSRPSSASEVTPLLQASSSTGSPSYNTAPPPCPVHHTSPPVPLASRRWPTLVALALLSTTILGIFLAGVFAPAAAARYAQEAVVFNVSSMSVESFTDHGVRARIQANVIVDASRVKSRATQTFGRVATWLAHRVTTEKSKVHVYHTEYGALLGTATTPALSVNVRNGQITFIEFISEVEMGSLELVRRLANDYLDGRLGVIRVRGEAVLDISSGILHFGKQRISEEMVFKEIPSLPNFQVNGLNFGKAAPPEQDALSVNASITIENPFPLNLNIPSLSFTILLPGCTADKLVSVAVARTSRLLVKPKTDIDVDVSAIIRSLHADLLTPCPKSHESPMDSFLGGYIHGNDTTVYVRGSEAPAPDTPQWLQEFLRSVTLPVPFPGHAFDNIIKSFDISNVKFQFPKGDPEPGSPEAAPRLSASVRAVVQLPEELSIPFNVEHLRAFADVSYEGKKFGTLNIPKWVPATSSLTHDGKYLQVDAEIDDAPLDVTDADVFRKVVSKMMFGHGEPVILGINGNTDAEIKTSLGEFVVSKIPSAGNIILDSLPALGSLPLPKTNSLVISDTTSQSITLRVSVTINNPMPWEAIVPYVNVHIIHQNQILGNASISNLRMLPGNNTVDVWAFWDPRRHGGEEAEKIGTQLMSEYVSGRNTTITIRAHKDSFPSLPLLSRALADFQVTLPTPRLGEGRNDAPPSFIETATMHLFTKTADFVISNPLLDNKITVNKINGTAKYNGSDLGTILYKWPFDIKPGKKGTTLTPRLPVDLSFGSVGHEAMKRALGGQLNIHAQALCDVQVGKFGIELFYNSSKPIAAHIRL